MSQAIKKAEMWQWSEEDREYGCGDEHGGNASSESLCRPMTRGSKNVFWIELPVELSRG